MAEQAMAPPDVTASSVFVLDADTGQPLYAKNEDEVFWILSRHEADHRLCLGGQDGRPAFGNGYDKLAPSRSWLDSRLERRDVWSCRTCSTAWCWSPATTRRSPSPTTSVATFLPARTSMATLFNVCRGDAVGRRGARGGPRQFRRSLRPVPANVASARDVGLIAANVFTDPKLLPAWACTERTVEIGGPKAADGHAPDHARDSRRGAGHRRQDRIACRQEYLQSRDGLACAERPDHRWRGL